MIYKIHLNRISGVMLSVLASNVVDSGFETLSPLSKQFSGVRVKTDWLRIRIFFSRGATYLAADCCFSDLVLSSN